MVTCLKPVENPFKFEATGCLNPGSQKGAQVVFFPRNLFLVTDLLPMI